MNKYQLNQLYWNIDISNNLNAVAINHYFFTNNKAKSTNRTLNMNYHGVYKSLYTFENAITLIILYENEKPYKDYNYSSSSPITYYINTDEIEDLIDHKIM